MLLPNFLAMAVMASTLVSGLPTPALQDNAASLVIERSAPPRPIDPALIAKFPGIYKGYTKWQNTPVKKNSKRTPSKPLDPALIAKFPGVQKVFTKWHNTPLKKNSK